MSGNLGTLFYGNVSVLPGYDSASSGVGNLYVSGLSVLSGASNTMTGTLSVQGATNLQSTLTVSSTATFNGSVNFTQSTAFTNQMTVSNTTNATSASTGALRVSGGFGVQSDTFLGGILNVAGNATLQSQLSVGSTSNFAGVMTISNTTESTAYTNGALVVAGGVGINKDLRVNSGNIFLAEQLVLNRDSENGETYLASPTNTLFINQNAQYDTYLNQGSTNDFNVAGATITNIGTGLQVLVTTDSTNSTSGSLQVAGGTGIAKSLWVGTNLHVNGASVLTGALSVQSTSQSTSTSTGGFILGGGAAIGKNAYIGGIVDVASSSGATSWLGSVAIQTNNSSANWVYSGALARTNGAWTTLKFAPVSSATSIMSILSNQVTIDQTTASTSASTGSFVTAGGCGIQGDLFVGLTSNFGGAAKFSSDIWLSGNNLYLKSFNTQTDGLIFSDSQSAGGPFLFGENGGALGTTSGSTVSALTWDTTQSVQILGTTETSSASTGALTVAGGIAAAKSIYAGTSVLLRNTSLLSTGNNLLINANSNSVNIRNVAGTVSGEFESTTLFFNFRTINITNPAPISPFVTFQIDKTTGHTFVLQTDDATGANTGSFQVSGGASIAKNLYIGGDLTVTGSISSTNAISFSNTDDSTSINTGSIVIPGGIGIAKSLYLGGDAHLISTSVSSSSTTGSLIVSGGAGIAGDLFVDLTGNFGSNLIVSGSSSLTGAVSVLDTTESSSISTGSLIISGGIGIAKNMYINGQQYIVNTTNSTSVSTGCLVLSGGLAVVKDVYGSGLFRITNATESSSVSSGSFVTSGGVGITKNLNVGGNTNFTGSFNTSGLVTFSNTTDATAPTAASVVLSGGLGIVQALHVGSTINSTSATTGGLVLSGGLGVASNFFLGGNQTLSGTNPLLSFNNSGLNPPSFTSRSVGTKILLRSTLSGSTADYAIGMNSNVLWTSIPQNSTTYSFNWYGGETLAMSLDGEGNLLINSTTNSTSSSTGGFILSGGAGIAQSVFIGGNISVNGTSNFNGTINANSNYVGSGTLQITNATNSTTTGNGSIQTAGGLGVTLNANIGGNLGVTGNSNLTGTLQVTGITTVLNTTDSSGISSGALVVNGGAGITKNMYIGGNQNVGGNLVITGDLIVNGTRTINNTVVTETTDNVLLVNSTPGGTANTGIAMKRYQSANDEGNGDVINNDTADETGTCNGSGTTTTIVLANSASGTNDHYKGFWILITGGTGQDQVRKIKSYNGTTKTVTIYDNNDQADSVPTWEPVEGMDLTTTTDNTSTYSIFSGAFIVSVWDETEGQFNVGGSPLNPQTTATFPITKEITLKSGIGKFSQEIKADVINEYNNNAGVTIDGILVKDSNFSNVNTINGVKTDVISTVQLFDNDLNDTATIPGTNSYGAYTVLVSCANSSGPSAGFMISGTTAHGGVTSRLVSSSGADGSHLTITWAQGEQPKLRFLNLPTGGNGTEISFIVRVSGVV